jgi:hypothetical protein
MSVLTSVKFNRLEKAYCLEYTDITEAFVISHHQGLCCTNVIRGHCCVLSHSCINVIPVTLASQVILALMWSQTIYAQQCTWVVFALFS